jgi:Tol biopolymer transport system component
MSPTVSPDGRTIAFAALGDLWLMPLGGKPGNLTRDRFLDTEPAWSPDGRYLVFSSTRGGRRTLWMSDREGRAPNELTRGGGDDSSPAWSPRLE